MYCEVACLWYVLCASLLGLLAHPSIYLAKMIAKRTNVAKEILSTEKQYVQNLRNLVAVCSLSLSLSGRVCLHNS